MLAELAAANAAFAVIKKAIANGQEIASFAKQIASIVDSKETLQKKVEKKKNSFFGASSDFEEFMALEEVKRKEDDLREFIQLYGRPGMWQDWVKFQAQARKERIQREAKRAEQWDEIVTKVTLTVVIVATFLLILAVTYFILQFKGII